MYNKHGLLIDSFEREYKSQNGKPVPYKFLGHENLFDLLTNIPDVVQLFPLPDGQHLLLAVPDEKTQHIAKAVGNQIDRVEGFNRKTADVIAKVGKDVKKKILNATGIKDKEVSDYVKKQFVELLESDDHIDGILLSELPTVYYKEFGYKIDYDEFGFQSLEEFCFHGLTDCVDMDLDNFQWKIVEKGMIGNTMSINTSKDVQETVKKKVIAVLESNPQGLTEEEFKNKFAARHRPLNFRDFCSKSLLEFACSIPDCVRVECFRDGQIVFFPSVPIQAHPDKVIQDLSSKIMEVLDGHNEGVPIAQFIQGYEGYFGDIRKEVTKAGVKNVGQLLELCSNVCMVAGDVVVPLFANDQSTYQLSSQANFISQAEMKHLVISLQKILRDCKDGKVPINSICQHYRDFCGENLDYLQLGFQSLKMLMEHVVICSDKVAVKEDTLYLTEDNTGHIQNVHHGTIGDIKLEPGWVRLVSSSNPDTLCLQLESGKRQLKEMETKMEQFYTWDIRGEMVDVETVRSGDLVASLYTDLTWHRARVLSVQCHKLELEFVDWGWRARVKMTSVRKLDSMFLTLAQQSVHMRYKEMQVVSDINWEDVVREGRGRGRLSRSTSGDVNIELFMRSPLAAGCNNNTTPLDTSYKVNDKFRNLIFDQIRKCR